MTSLRILLPTLIASGLVLAAPAARAAASEDDAPAAKFERQMREAEALLRQGFDKMMGSVETLLRAVPQYEMPQMNENGDIIIRRKRPVEEGQGGGFPATPNGPTI
ncbi:MAG TPA: hypothetical protein VFA50_15660 [Stellaceae bacterium]|nr:hypothetical protein [Stellaceae bacterium]